MKVRVWIDRVHDRNGRGWSLESESASPGARQVSNSKGTGAEKIIVRRLDSVSEKHASQRPVHGLRWLILIPIVLRAAERSGSAPPRSGTDRKIEIWKGLVHDRRI